MLAAAQQLFTRVGLNRLSEEDLIEALDVAPATFYGMFADKDDLIMQAQQQDLERQKQEHAELFAQLGSPVEQLLALHLHGLNELEKVKGLVHLDMQQLHPRAWQLVVDHMDHYSNPLICQLLRKGVVQKQLRNDINCELIARLLREQMGLIFNPLAFPPTKYKLAEVYRSTYGCFIRGLCTEAGLRIADAHFEQFDRMPGS